MSWIKRPIHRFRYRFDEAYRIQIGVGLSVLRSNRQRKALIRFCEEELKDRAHMKLNPERKMIYEMTLKLYKQGLSDKAAIYTKLHSFKLPNEIEPRMYNDVDTFIEDHVGWYWN